jgi:hypothetical protein
MTTQALPGFARADFAGRRGRWIESPSFDLVFFVLGPVLTLVIVWGSLLNMRFAAYLGFILAFSHYLSTLSFFAWDENRPRHRARWLAFYGGPAFIAAVFCLLLVYRVPLVIQFVLFFWNVFHVSRQSCGLASLYRHRNGVADPRQRNVTNAALLSMNFWFCLWNIESHPEVIPVLAFVGKDFAYRLWAAAGVLALAMLGRLVWSFVGRARAGHAPTGPELLIVTTGIALFHPFLWLSDSGGATFSMLLPHYVQYLGIVWLLHRRKFKDAGGSPPQRVLQRLSASTPLWISTLLSATLVLLVVKIAAHRVGHAAAFESFYLLVAMMHFYLDGLFWAFSDPVVRRSMAPYLTGTLAPQAPGTP